MQRLPDAPHFSTLGTPGLRHLSACYDRKASRKGPPLQGSDSSPDDPLVDFPLRETEAPRPGFGLRPDTTLFQPEPPLATATEGRPAAAAEPPSLFASSIDEPRQRSGVSVVRGSCRLVSASGSCLRADIVPKGSTPVAAPAIENPAAHLRDRVSVRESTFKRIEP